MDPAKVNEITVYTDGGCVPNPGVGTYAAVLLCGPHRKELMGSFRLTTNNRMEIMAVIVALEAIKQAAIVTVHLDSEIVCGYLSEHAQYRARQMGESQIRLSNGDLRLRLHRAVGRHVRVVALKVKGHAGVAENERCDFLANLARRAPGLHGEDEGYSPATRQRTMALPMI